MRGNINEVERILRILLSVMFVAIGLTYQAALIPLAMITMLTDMIGWCPLRAVARVFTKEINGE